MLEPASNAQFSWDVGRDRDAAQSNLGKAVYTASEHPKPGASDCPIPRARKSIPHSKARVHASAGQLRQPTRAVGAKGLVERLNSSTPPPAK